LTNSIPFLLLLVTRTSSLRRFRLVFSPLATTTAQALLNTTWQCSRSTLHPEPNPTRTAHIRFPSGSSNPTSRSDHHNPRVARWESFKKQGPSQTARTEVKRKRKSRS